MPVIKRTRSSNKGFTLIEVLISCVLIGIAFLTFEIIMYTQQYFISYAKHKLQAIHAARTILDMERVAGFPFINNNQPPFAPPVYAGCDMPGAIVTVSVLPPYNDATCNYRKTVQIKVSWKENMCGSSAIKNEFLTTDIANESQLN